GFASPTRVVAAGANGTTVRSDDAGDTFAGVGGRLGGSYAALRAGATAGTAYAAGADGALATTSDGGRSWTTGTVPTTGALLDVAFPSTTLGYALDRDGGLFRTDDGGDSWKPLGTGSTRRPRALLAPDEQTVLVVGPVGVRRSTDAGEDFAEVRARAVLHAQLGGVTRTAGGAIFAWGPKAVVRSDDGGRSWTALPRPGASGALVAQVAFSSARAGLLRDAAGRIFRTLDAGRRWTRLDAVGTAGVTGMAVRSSRSFELIARDFGGHAGGWLLRTLDGGQTWQPQFVGAAPIAPTGLVSASGGVDYVLAGSAQLLFSRTGGVAGTPSQLTLSTRARRLPSARGITVSGRLTPASAGSQVVVSALLPGRGWRQHVVRVASNGTFVSAWRVPRGTTTFVAQWDGDFKSAGAGSRAMTVTVSGGRAARPRGRR
ncbi:MAG TPA: hypothetical protein VFV85_04115, partial [Conexibacter sp.]|nr:hypothetical protein [Conexibacter sp.]